MTLREGRWDEASDRLERYFLLRLRFTHCARIEQCDRGLQRRLDHARSRRLCTPDELPDPETLFPDDELLSLSWRLREVS